MTSLRVMTFNIRGALFDDGVNRWPNRVDLNVRTILRYAPDVIGLQEAHQDNLSVYREQLSGYDYAPGPPYNNEEPYLQYTAICWNASRLRLAETGGFWLSLTPEQHSGSWDTACIRSATWARLVWLDTGQSFVHLNTHLDHVSEMARVEGTKLILQRLQPAIEEDVPVIITGDFNCKPGSTAYRCFAEYGFVDAYTAAGHTAQVNTFHAFQGRAYTPRPPEVDRIDWILTRDGRQRFSIEACTIVDDAEPPLYPSDHYPVLADLTLE